jgi:allophanate hydrolase subunit 2
VVEVGSPAAGPVPPLDGPPVTAPPVGEVLLRIRPGPRRDWFAGGAWRALLEEPWTVGRDADRVGLRLDGPELQRLRHGELPSEGVVTGALQVPTGGRPVLFLADHPTTGGYPVIAVVAAADVPLAGQLRPGQRVAFAEGRAPVGPWRTVGPRLPPA